MTKQICPRCKGNGYFYVKKEVRWPQKQEDIVVQCPQCDSEGEIEMMDEGRMKSLEAEKKILQAKHTQKLEKEISNLMKDKAELQDQLDKHIDKEMKKS